MCVGIALSAHTPYTPYTHTIHTVHSAHTPYTRNARPFEGGGYTCTVYTTPHHTTPHHTTRRPIQHTQKPPRQPPAGTGGRQPAFPHRLAGGSPTGPSGGLWHAEYGGLRQPLEEGPSRPGPRRPTDGRDPTVPAPPRCAARRSTVVLGSEYVPMCGIPHGFACLLAAPALFYKPQPCF